MAPNSETAGSEAPAYPFKWTPLSDEEKSERKKLFQNVTRSSEVEMVRAEPGGMLMPEPYARMAEAVYNFEVREDDIWIITYPKCGTTWTQETVWQMTHDVDTAACERAHLLARSPFLEMTGLIVDPAAFAPPPEDPTQPPPPPTKEQMDALRFLLDSLNWAKDMPSPRIIKSHMPFEFLPPNLLEKCKVIYVCRNVKDCCVSFFHHWQNMPMAYGFSEDFAKFAELFKEGNVGYGSYWDHLKSGWTRRNHPNMKFVWFEEMKRDHMKVMKELCAFTGYNLTEEQLEKLEAHVSIDNMRAVAKKTAKNSGEKQTADHFFRKGKVGDWKNYFQGEKNKEWDEWIQQNMDKIGVEMSFE